MDNNKNNENDYNSVFHAKNTFSLTPNTDVNFCVGKCKNIT